MLNKKMKIVICGAVIFAMLLGLGFKIIQMHYERLQQSIILQLADEKEQNEVQQLSEETAGKDAVERNDDASTAERKMIKVHVAGAVSSPGIIELPADSRIYDAVSAAGITAESDLDTLNLAQPISDGSKIYVSFLTQETNVTNDDTADNGNIESQLKTDSFYESPDESQQSQRMSNSSTGNISGLININNADLSELTTLPGTGEVLGQRIIDYREANGGFDSIEAIKNVSGIGDKRYDEIKSLITV